MRSARYAWLLCLTLLALPIQAQQTAAQPGATSPPAQRDPQAVSIVNQTLAVAGGVAAISSIHDYTASGNITFHSDADVQCPVTLSGLGLNLFRQDANLPSGMRSLAMSNGQTSTKQNGVVRQLPVQTPMITSGLLIPSLQLAAALNSPQFSVIYKGIVQVDGRSTHDIRIQLVLPDAHDSLGVIAEYFTADFFVDAATYQVVMIQDVVQGHLRSLTRIVRYSDYTPVGGILVPFMIDHQVDSQPFQTIQLQQITFNTDLQNSNFVLQ